MQVENENTSIKHVAQSDLEKRLQGSSFFVFKKLLLYQRDTDIHRLRFIPSAQPLLLIFYTNGLFVIHNCFDNFEGVIKMKLAGATPDHIQPDSRKSVLAFGARDSHLTVYNYQSQQYVLQQSNQASPPSSVARTQQHTAVGFRSGEVHIFDNFSRFCVVSVSECQQRVTGLRFLDRETLVFSSVGGLVVFYSLKSWRVFRKCKIENRILSLEVETDGDVVFVSGFEPTSVYVLSKLDGQILAEHSFAESPIDRLLFSHLNQTLFAASWSKQLVQVQPFSKTLNKLEISVSSDIKDIKLGRSEELLFVANAQNEIQIYSSRSFDLVSVINCGQQFFRSEIASVGVSFDGSRIFATGSVNKIYAYDVKHKLLVGQTQVSANKSYDNFLLKKSSRHVVDGMSLKKLKHEVGRLEGGAESALVLPGSERIRDANGRVMENGNLSVSGDGLSLCFSNDEGVHVYAINSG